MNTKPASADVCTTYFEPRHDCVYWGTYFANLAVSTATYLINQYGGDPVGQVNNAVALANEACRTITNAPPMNCTTWANFLANNVLTLVTNIVNQYAGDPVGQATSVANLLIGVAQQQISVWQGVVDYYVGYASATVNQQIQALQPTINGLIATATTTVNNVLTQVPTPSQVQAMVNGLVAIGQGMIAAITTPDGLNNTGDAPGVGDPAVLADRGIDPVRMAFKLSGEAAVEQRMPLNLAHYLTPETERTIVFPPGTCIPGQVLSGSGTAATSSSCPSGTQPAEPDPATGQVTLALHQQQTSYTCAPASARTVLHGMTGTDFGEPALANHMGTTSEGTYYPRLEKTLNSYQSSDDFIGDPDPEMNPNRLMAQVVHAVRSRNHNAILNVNQSVFQYWNRPFNPNNKHYLTAYGYNLRSGGSIYIGDVAPGAPYGTHQVSLEETTRAVTANKGLVIR